MRNGSLAIADKPRNACVTVRYNYTKIAINHDLEHSSITNCFVIVLYHVVQLRFDNSQYTNMLCYVMGSCRLLLSVNQSQSIAAKFEMQSFARSKLYRQREN